MKTTTLNRDSYGALQCSSTTNDADRAEYMSALALCAKNGRDGLIDAARDDLEWDRKHRASGSAVHHEIYDIHNGIMLVCVRHSEGSKYGVRTSSKEYFVLEEGKVPVPHSTPARAAKAAGATVGEILRVIGALDGKLPS